MLGYKILLAVLAVFFPLCVFSVFRHPRRYSKGQIRGISIFLFVSYLFPWLEVATNYVKGAPTLVAIGPFYNVVPLIFTLALLYSFVPFAKVRNFLGLTVCMLPFPLLLCTVSTLLYHAKNTNYFNERTAIYVLGQMGLILFGLSLIRNREVEVKMTGIFASVGFILGIYGGFTLLNAKIGTHYYGLSMDEDAYFILPQVLSASPDLLLPLNFAFIAVSMSICALFFAWLQRKKSPEDS